MYVTRARKQWLQNSHRAHVYRIHDLSLVIVILVYTNHRLRTKLYNNMYIYWGLIFFLVYKLLSIIYFYACNNTPSYKLSSVYTTYIICDTRSSLIFTYTTV